jgi:hypothetical protein
MVFDRQHYFAQFQWNDAGLHRNGKARQKFDDQLDGGCDRKQFAGHIRFFSIRLSNGYSASGDIHVH